jgi:hypothetical protein
VRFHAEQAGRKQKAEYERLVAVNPKLRIFLARLDREPRRQRRSTQMFERIIECRSYLTSKTLRCCCTGRIGLKAGDQACAVYRLRAACGHHPLAARIAEQAIRRTRSCRLNESKSLANVVGDNTTIADMGSERIDNDAIAEAVAKRLDQ